MGGSTVGWDAILCLFTLFVTVRVRENGLGVEGDGSVHCGTSTVVCGLLLVKSKAKGSRNSEDASRWSPSVTVRQADSLNAKQPKQKTRYSLQASSRDAVGDAMHDVVCDKEEDARHSSLNKA